MAGPVTSVESAGGAGSMSDAPPIENVKGIAKRYGSSLESVLQKRMAEEGPLSALDACSIEAARIGSEISRESGWSVRRVTDRTRNPLDMPDEYEAKQLENFSTQSVNPDAPLASYKVVNENGVRYARFMKGIRIKPVCLTCHGDAATTKALDAKLAELYPHDKARGYKLGDLRGALSIKIKLD